MPYIKISDPNIIDLAAWHQVINVVNQHTDSLDAITSTTGVSFNPTYDDDGGWKTVFDPGTQMIQYGRIIMDKDNNLGITDDDGGVYYEEETYFPQSFSGTPAVVLTGTSATNTSKRADWDVTVSSTYPDRFTVKLVNATKTAISGSWTIKISFMALGPKS